MRFPATLVMAMMFPAAAVAADEAAPACYAAPSQAGLDACAAGELGKADAELNRVWKAIQGKYADQPSFLAKLKSAQQAWLKFRDAEVEAAFPVAGGQDAQVQYGSVYPMCVSQARTELTRQRTRQLEAWLDGAREGDVCSGSVKPADELK